jgi:hypothetical protein
MISLHRTALAYGSITLACLIAGCSTSKGNTALAVGATLALGHTPTTNIVQTYYLGVFDPREQLPPTIYRVRVQGQSSGLSWTKFASGWVHADLVDSLSGSITMEKTGVKLGQTPNGDSLAKELDKSGLNRRLVMFGPEGFREAPKNHRLVVVMGNNPDGFFGAVDRALGTLASVTQPLGAGPEVVRELWSDLSRLRQEKRAVQTLLDVAAEE